MLWPALLSGRSHSADSFGFVEVSQQRLTEAPGQKAGNLLLRRRTPVKPLVLLVSDPVKGKSEELLRWSPQVAAEACAYGPLLKPTDGAQWEYCSGAIRKSLITLNQNIPAFPLFVYRTQS